MTPKPLSIPEALLARGLPAALSIVASIRREVTALARRSQRNPESLIAAARKIVAAHEPLLARTMRDSLLMAWLTTARKIVGELPDIAPSTASAVLPPLRPPFGPTDGGLGTSEREPEPEPIIRFPQIEAAAHDLQRRGFFDQAQFNALDQDARRTAFTVARVHSLDAMRRIRDAITEDITEGGTLEQFRVRVAADVAGALNPAQVEAIYRTQVAAAMGAGQRAILDDPLVGDEFPYMLWTATHDSRTRPDHLAMEQWGPGGIAVYRRDDPMWETCYPPASWNCRCWAVVLSLEDAAKHGSREAAKWLKTGVPPASPLFARKPYPIKIPAGWPVHDRIASVL